MRRRLYCMTLTLIASMLQPVAFVYADEDEEEEEAIELIFSAAERAEMGIVTAPVGLHALAPEIKAPGEVALNVYRTSQVAPRIDAQVVSRHARMGGTVSAGDPLVTLSSVDMAEAVGDLLVDDREWRRVKALGRDVVSEARFVAAEVARQQAYAKVLAYGMPETELKRLLAEGDASQATGEYTLYAPHDGVVIQDDFVVGEVVDAGRLLMELSDLSTLWIEARVDPELASRIQVGDTVRVSADDETWIEGIVTQRYQRLDESTRTRGIRIEVPNSGDLAPGQFVNIAVSTAAGAPVLAVPRDAVVLILGNPMVFALEDNEFEPRPVEVGMTTADWRAVTAGVESGEEIAVAGVFQLKALLLKSQIGDTD